MFGGIGSLLNVHVKSHAIAILFVFLFVNLEIAQCFPGSSFRLQQAIENMRDRRQERALNEIIETYFNRPDFNDYRDKEPQLVLLDDDIPDKSSLDLVTQKPA
ncbi:hypothetical protein WR25_16837 [Diploscapter pachys]|uniref:Uncharacterized protein n=1 Tax=Diploscapter pachys TaxID=2018661 RepID=A0A2A2LYH0_9BILA|nr:hypothetical protein WR25_16837 [Diploscapter pachys]